MSDNFRLFGYFLGKQKVTKKGTTNTNRLRDLVPHAGTPGLINPAVRAVRGQATRRRIEVIFEWDRYQVSSNK